MHSQNTWAGLQEPIANGEIEEYGVHGKTDGIEITLEDIRQAVGQLPRNDETF